jgi:hypothetical protein
MVLISIIVGLGIAHILFGVGRLIDRRAGGPKIELGVAHGFWLGYVFLWTVQFWWWEFRFSELDPEWTLGLYLFLISYAVALFLLAVILVPHSWDSVDNLDSFLVQRRVWFYWALAGGTCIDVNDALLKGGISYIGDLGASMWILWLLTAIACVVGLRSERLRYHQIGAASVFFWQLVQAFDDLPTLGF